MKKKSACFRRLLLTVVNCALLAQAAFAFQIQKTSDEKFAQILQKVQSRLDELHDSLKFPGASVGFVLPDGRAASASTGFADLETKRSLKTSDRLPAGSIGKTFVAAETLLLVQQGKLNLDEKIERRLGGENWFARLPNAKDITLRMLLNHSSGMPDHVDDKDFQKSLFKNFARDLRYEELIAYILGRKPLFPAGKGYYYADTNYILLGLIVEKTTGKNLYTEIAENFLRPFKLGRTIPSNALVLPQTANGYWRNKPVIVNGKFIYNPQWEWAGGGFASTPEDLARWAQALYSGEVLQTKYTDEMLDGTSVGEGKNYGLGVEIKQDKFGKSYGHDGEIFGYLSDMRYFPNYKMAIAVQVNADETPEANKFMASAIDDFGQIIITGLVGEKLTEAEKLEFQKNAEDWLSLIRAGKFAESWESISAQLKAKYAKENWGATLQPLLKKAGALKSRKLKSVIYSDSETVVIDFESSFTKIPRGTETVILKLEKDGQWRVASYTISD